MSCKVLVVDDSKLARMAVAKVLMALRPDWSRVEASNADEALAILNEPGVDVVLLDYNMPGQDGLTLAAEIRRLKPQMPVAIISANHQVEIVNQARDVGATFLPKPLTEKAFAEFLGEAAHRLGSVET